MGCCNSLPNEKKYKPVFPKGGIQNYIKTNEDKFNEIIKKGPLIPIYERQKQAESLPRTPLKVYDENSNESELHFETEAILSTPTEGQGLPDRVFYDEIKKIEFVPIEGYCNSFVTLVLDTKVGFRSFFYVQEKYQTIISKILK